MKTILSVAILLFTTCVQSQDWYEFEVDSIVSIQFPSDEAYELDTMIKRVHIYQLRVDANGASYSIQKSRLEDESEYENIAILPYDSVSLLKYYSGVINGISNKSSYKVIEEQGVIKGELIGRRVVFSTESNIKVLETEMYVINDYLYQALYLADSSFDESNKEYFINSLSTNSNVEIGQFKEEAYTFRLAYLIGKLTAYLLIIMFVVWLIRRLVRLKK